MCGIAGFWQKGDLSKEEVHERIKRMNESLRHRGPDEDGFFVDGNVALANRRLSILDLSGGRQPIFNEDQSIVVVYNGEIYNYPTLRAMLEQKGHRFATSTDTEILVHLYEEYGPEFVRHLRGMFAFALYDRRRGEIILARDPFGIKPLVYAELPQGFFFASELKALLTLPSFSKEVDPEALSLYVAYNYIPAPYTIWKAARRLEPGYLLRIRDGKIIDKRRYFELNPQPWEGDIEEAVEVLEYILRDSVKAHLLSDVPLGAFLSGGLDSSLICALAQETLSTSLYTFTITFPEWPVYDESHYARRVAEYLGTQHEEIPVTAKDVREVFSEILIHLDEPFADSSLINVAIISKITRKSVKVALSGDGGDELFAGYNKYQGLKLAKYLYPFKPFLWCLSKIPLPERRGSAFGERVRQWRKLVRLLHPDSFERFCRATIATEPDLPRKILKGIFLKETFFPLKFFWDEAQKLFREDEVNQWLWTDIHFVLPYDMLHKVDTASMCYSLEVRVPLVDIEVAKLAFRLPGKWKLSGLERKMVLKRLAKKFLPQEIVHRPKGGFGVPIGEWLRNEMREEFKVWLSPLSIKNSPWNVETVQNLLKEHFSLRRDRFWELWNIFVFEVWRKQWDIQF